MAKKPAAKGVPAKKRAARKKTSKTKASKSPRKRSDKTLRKSNKRRRTKPKTSATKRPRQKQRSHDELNRESNESKPQQRAVLDSGNQRDADHLRSLVQHDPAATFVWLLNCFRGLWFELGNAPLVLEFAAPMHPSDLTFGRKGSNYVCVGGACLPLPNSNDSKFALAIIRQVDDNKNQIEEFQQLLSVAGAWLPAVIRDGVGDYYWTAIPHPAGWWTALLAHHFKITAIDIDKGYLVRPKIINPLEASIDLIERLRLNTDSPGWNKEIREGVTTPRLTMEATALLAFLKGLRMLCFVTSFKNIRRFRFPADFSEVKPRDCPTRLSLNTAKKAIKQLANADYISWPEGKKKGFQITPAGCDALEQIVASLRA